MSLMNTIRQYFLILVIWNSPAVFLDSTPVDSLISYVAQTYMRLRMEEKALASVERVVALDPDHQNSRLL